MEHQKVVFIDCDGVLCNARSVTCDYEDGDDSLWYDPDGTVLPLEKRCIAALRHIVEETGAVVVLSTTWRIDPRQRDFLVKALQSNDIQVIGDTPDLGGCGRGAEIHAWLQDHLEVQRFVALEDQENHIRSFQNHLPAGSWVQTSMGIGSDPLSAGLTDDKAMEAIKILTSADAEKESDADELRKRRKLDFKSGAFLRFPGVTVVCNMVDSTEGPIGKLADSIRTSPILGKCFTPLPPASYHVTVLDIHCQYELGLSDEAHLKLLSGPQWAIAAKDVESAAFVPKLSPKKIILSPTVMLVELESISEDTPGHPKDLLLGKKLAQELNCKLQKHVWHFTLAYGSPDELKAFDPHMVETERLSLEVALLEACRNASDGCVSFDQAYLCRFEDMTAFVPWDGKIC